MMITSFQKLIAALITLCMITAPQLYAQTSQNGINVQGEAERKLPADIIMLDIEIRHEDDEASVAQGSTAKVSAKVIAYLKKQQAVSKVETRYMHLYPRYNESSDELKTQRYISSHVIHVVFKDISKYGEIMEELLSMGVNGIQSVQFDSSKREEVERELLAEAIKNAREKAIYMAEQLQQSIGPALHISDNSQNFNPIAYRQMDVAESGSIAPQELKIHVRVNITFELKSDL